MLNALVMQVVYKISLQSTVTDKRITCTAFSFFQNLRVLLKRGDKGLLTLRYAILRVKSRHDRYISFSIKLETAHSNDLIMT